MKVLMLFVDMLRPNRFGSYNNEIQTNQIDDLIESLGGTLYTNCFSPAPDTPRSMACYYTGLLPKENGCDSRVKWPGKFLKEGFPTLFDPFIEQNYQLNFFSNPNERQGGLFPPGIEETGVHNQDYDLKKYLSNLTLADNHLVFLSIPDYHWALQDWGYTRKAERVAISETSKSLDIVFDQLNKDDFDHIFIFSDHGFKFNAQLRAEEGFKFLNRDRANIFMFYRKKGDQELSHKDKLCSIQDLSHSVNDIMGLENNFSLLNDRERDYVVIEDHQSVSGPKVNEDVDIWAIVTKNEIYVRTLEYSVSVKNNHVVNTVVNQKYDEILKRESQFGRYFDEYKKVFAYHELILAQTTFMNGNPRPDVNKMQKILAGIEVVKDIVMLRLKKFGFDFW